MRLGLDFDGVISDTIPQMIAFARTEHDLELSPFDCVAPGGPAGLTPDVWLQLIADTHNTPYALSMPPTFGAVPALRDLSVRHEVVIVTARRGEALANSEAWLEQAGLGACVRSIVSSAGRTKADVADELGLAALVDDVLENLRDLHGEAHPILWDAVYNRDVPTDSRVRRVHGWADLAALLRAGAIS